MTSSAESSLDRTRPANNGELPTTSGTYEGLERRMSNRVKGEAGARLAELRQRVSELEITDEQERKMKIRALEEAILGRGEEKVHEVVLAQRKRVGDEKVIRSRDVTTVTREDIDAGLAARGMRMREDGTIEPIPSSVQEPTSDPTLDAAWMRRMERGKAKRAVQGIPEQSSNPGLEAEWARRKRVRQAVQSASRPTPPVAPPGE